MVTVVKSFAIQGIDGFPRRNRLISEWSDKLIVVSPGKESGTFITAEYEKMYGRDVEVIYTKESKKYDKTCK